VTRRADPERIYAARRAATFHRLVDADRLDELDAEHWIARWERHAAELELARFEPAFWENAAGWIRLERAEERRR
jgi:hypothetical protein